MDDEIRIDGSPQFMDTQLRENTEEPLAETPEDVAILYSWANLHGAKYRDFSASRREYRAQVRHRAAEDMRLSELGAQQQAEAAAAEAERVAREAERAARSSDGYESAAERERALREAEDAGRRAAAERVEAARRAEAAAIAEAMARKEEREIAEAHASAQRQAARWADSDVRRRNLAGPQPVAPGLASDPYEFVQPDGDSFASSPFEAPNKHNLYDSSVHRVAVSPVGRGGDVYASRVSGERRAYRPELEIRRRPQGYRPDENSGVRPVYRAPAAEVDPVRARINTNREQFGTNREEPGRSAPRADERDLPQTSTHREAYAPQGWVRDEAPQRAEPVAEKPGPAWLYESSSTAAVQPAAAGASSVADTLQYSRERVASRWYALKGAFEPGQEPVDEVAPARKNETRTPVLAVFSLAGGVGKTSLVATLGRTLSSLGEKVLLADTTSQGLLPYYFGASELRPGVVRTFSPPVGSTDAPIYMVSYDADQRATDRGAQEALGGELAESSSGTHRILLDLNASSGWVIRRLARMSPTVLVPVTPDMNSVISLHAVEKFFADAADADGRPILPYYIFNQFDATLPLHLDVREVLRQKLGERLLPFVIRRAPAVSEALAEGMTVVDYSPEAPVAEDYLNIATWLRSVSPPATQGFRKVRWSER